MDKELKIKISVDKKTGAIKVVNGEFEELSHKAGKAGKGVDSFNKSLINIAKAGASLYALKQAFDFAEKTTLDLNGFSIIARFGTTTPYAFNLANYGDVVIKNGEIKGFRTAIYGPEGPLGHGGGWGKFLNLRIHYWFYISLVLKLIEWIASSSFIISFLLSITAINNIKSNTPGI